MCSNLEGFRCGAELGDAGAFHGGFVEGKGVEVKRVLARMRYTKIIPDGVRFYIPCDAEEKKYPIRVDEHGEIWEVSPTLHLHCFLFEGEGLHMHKAMHLRLGFD